MKTIIQNSIDSYHSLSDMVTISKYFSKYTKFLIAGRITGEEGITLVFYNGPNSDLYMGPDDMCFQFDKTIDGAPDFEVGRVEGLSDDHIGTWCNTADFVIPKPELPTLGQILSLPAIAGPPGVIWSFLEGGLDEWMTCDCYDLDSEEVSKFDSEVSFEAIARRTTDYCKYGQVLYRMILRREVVGMISTSGRYLDTIMIYPINLTAIKDFMKELQAKCQTKEYAETAEKEFSLGDTDINIDAELLDMIAAGGDLDVNS